MEIWRDIKDFQNYQVSSQGRVRSVDHETEARIRGGVVRIHRKGMVLRPAEGHGGYLMITLCKEGKRYDKVIHRLVAESFLDNPENLPQVNHKDEDKHNNCAENLEWCSAEYNTNYGTRNERMAKAQTNHPKKSKPVGQFSLDGKLIKVWPSTNEAGRNGFDGSCVSACCRGEQKTHKTYTWRYL